MAVSLGQPFELICYLLMSLPCTDVFGMVSSYIPLQYPASAICILQQRLHSALAHNSAMEKQYNQLQGEYLAVKSRMIEALEREEDNEMTIKDMKQVIEILNYNTCMYTHMIYTTLLAFYSWSVCKFNYLLV